MPSTTSIHTQIPWMRNKAVRCGSSHKYTNIHNR